MGKSSKDHDQLLEERRGRCRRRLSNQLINGDQIFGKPGMKKLARFTAHFDGSGRELLWTHLSGRGDRGHVVLESLGVFVTEIVCECCHVRFFAFDTVRKTLDNFGGQQEHTMCVLGQFLTGDIELERSNQGGAHISQEEKATHGGVASSWELFRHLSVQEAGQLSKFIGKRGILNQVDDLLSDRENLLSVFGQNGGIRNDNIVDLGRDQRVSSQARHHRS
mmetsp:Transcript_26086/g.65561  ORF Transcript_26086/g.65561 Transcript_26086/m.65561 type:complete len:221 (-) Transcript_26086:1780-2442(-)